MRFRSKLHIKNKKAICYSGFRHGQFPNGIYPDYEQVKEDLLLLHGHWQYLRLYDCDQHAEMVLKVIKDYQLNFKIMLGAYINAEINNYNCPWHGGIFSNDKLIENQHNNENNILKLINLTKEYDELIFAVSVGNEACVDWTDHYVSPSKVAEYIRQVRKKLDKPITYCDNYVPWLSNLDEVANEVDFISIHSYPVWENRQIADSMEITKANYQAVKDKFPKKDIVISEAGWTTFSNGNGINPNHVSEEKQKIYFENLMQWSLEEQILIFYFEAFDEPWKGSPEPGEPEKHWGLFNVDRTPKLAIKEILKERHKIINLNNYNPIY